ncbi:hypothetical protein [Geosporobacter ferrireducens]|uniref:Spore coat protein n=1 Tax=Geosporobacter ferrireducens TaxID=1424294 RepID=A0A1D8GGA3_9FIRM|nr:hypothetical protein [Geosporobacter ferrireducens]AOT69925.1 hypothetical protein Gferi_10225 [Geosporobacter ferrireducens]MTI54379.1 hypothetical protein [Geosporobacter ferrireducens]
MFTGNQNLEKPHLDVPNLKVLEDQLNYESIMAKKLGQYAGYCTDPELKNVCQQGAQRHKQNFNTLLDYLNAHQ